MYWYTTFAYAHVCFLPSKNFQNKKVDIFNMFLFWNSSNYGTVFSGGGWYSTMDATLVIHFSPFIRIIGRRISCSSIVKILLTFIVRFRFIMWYLLVSMIINGGTGFFTRTPTQFWVIFAKAVWLMLYKYSQKIKQQNIVINKLNAWYIFLFAYYWPACTKIHVQIGE